LLDGSDGLAGDRLTYRDVELSRYACGRAVVIGDAARSMSPQLGTGAQLAMEDAALLGSAVSQHDDLSDLPACLRENIRMDKRNLIRCGLKIPRFPSSSERENRERILKRSSVLLAHLAVSLSRGR